MNWKYFMRKQHLTSPRSIHSRKRSLNYWPKSNTKELRILEFGICPYAPFLSIDQI
ncbi:uncharacterized protein J3R85_019926 [Psidium guajava]|nr:uncharacterized protein J3R85_019926 [Psidium guajava]